MSLSGPSDEPLKGLRLVFLRDSPGIRRASALCHELGAEVLMAPVMDLVDPNPEDYHALNRTIDRLSDHYDWVILTSQEAVKRFFARCELRHQVLGGEHPQFAVVGAETEAQLRRHGIRPALTPGRNFSQSGLMEAFDQIPTLDGQRFLLPVAEEARRALERYLASRGAVVDRLTLYRTVALTLEPKVVRQFTHKVIDGIFYTSPFSVKALAQNLRQEHYAQFQGATAFSIGAQTSQALADHGVKSIIESPTASIPALVQVAVSFWEKVKRS